jgi:hypothetical protein
MHVTSPGRVLPDQVFDLEQAARAGWSLPAIRNAVARGHVRRVRRGLYVAAEPQSLGRFAYRALVARNNALAASKAVRGSTMSHRSAALWHGLPVLDTSAPCVTVTPGPSPNQPGVHLHRARLQPAHLDPVGRVPVTSAARTVVDLGREHGIAEAVVAADAALRKELVTLNDLHDVLGECRGWPGTRAARSAVELSDGRSESVLESLSRLAIHEHDLPVPALQVELRDGFGGFVGRVDFLFTEWGVVGEADGLSKYEQHSVEEHEQRRRQRIENLGYAFVRWQFADLTRFDVVADRIRHAAKHRFAGHGDPWRPAQASA